MKNYSIYYTNKNGSTRFNSTDEQQVIRKTKSLFANKKQAAIYLGNDLIGSVNFDENNKLYWSINFGTL